MASTTVILSTSSMMFRSKNDSIDEVGAEQHDDRGRRGQDPEPDDDRERGDEQPDADRGPGLTEGAATGDRRRLGLRRVMEVEPRVVELAGPQRGEPVVTGGDGRAELDLLGADGAAAAPRRSRSSSARAVR